MSASVHMLMFSFNIDSYCYRQFVHKFMSYPVNNQIDN